MPRHAPVREEGAARSRPASTVFPGVAQAVVPPVAIAPPVSPAPSSGGGSWGPGVRMTDAEIRVQTSQGSFLLGLLFGASCGLIALLVSMVPSSMKENTRQGVRVGFGIGMVIGLLMRMAAR